jgi:AAA ATPase domain
MLLERDAELAAIGDRLDEGGLVVVEGAAGIGKTTLLAAAAELAAARGTRVLAARAAPLEQAYGFGVVRQLFEPVRAGCDDAEWQRLTADAAGLALRALDPAAAVAAPGDDVTHATLHGLFWLAANLAAQGPLVVAVDDAHWADPPSLRWLGYLARRLEGLPVLALVAVRSGEPPSEPRLLDDLLAEPRALLLRPRPLGPDSSAAVVRERIGDAAPEFCTACHDATGGNPFLLGALVASVRAEGVGTDARAAVRIEAFGPEAVARALDRQLERLGARARAGAGRAGGGRGAARSGLAGRLGRGRRRSCQRLAARGRRVGAGARRSAAARADGGRGRCGGAGGAARVRPPDPARGRGRGPGPGRAGAVALAGCGDAQGRGRGPRARRRAVARGGAGG